MYFSFIHITDHHLADSEAALISGFSPAFALQAVLRHIAEHVGTQADFIISTGDLVDKASAMSYQSLRQLLNVQDTVSEAPGPLLISAEGLREFPMYFMPGNHDDRNHFFQSLFPKSLVAPLMNAAFVHKGVQFICLDWGPESKAVMHSQTLKFLRHSLETEMPSIILMHYPLVAIGSRWLDELLADNLDLFWEVVSGRNVLGVLSGHVHTTYEQVVNGVPIFGLRSTAFPFLLHDEPLVGLLPPHYRLVSVRDGVVTSKIYEVRL